MEEIWNDIKGYEGVYLVSNTGKVKSLPRKVMFGEQARIVEERILQENNNGRGYVYVSLSYKNIKTREYIHRLVAKEFLPNKWNKREVNHKNGIKNDNNVSNLEWVSASENKEHAYLTGLTKNRPTDLDVTEVNMVIDLLKTEKYTQDEICNVFKINENTLTMLKKKERIIEVIFKETKIKKASRGYEIEVTDKENNEVLIFPSSKKAAEYFDSYPGYFSEVITKYNGENQRFKAKYTNVDKKENKNLLEEK